MNYQEIPLRQHTLPESEWLDSQAADQQLLLPLVPTEPREARLRRILETVREVTTADRLHTRTVRDLVVLNKARKMLAEAKSIADLKDVRDVGQATIKWAKSRRDVGSEAVNDAMEIVLESERRLGTMLAETPKHNGDPRLHDVTRLKELGISKIQSHRWQAEASVCAECDQAVGTVRPGTRRKDPLGPSRPPAPVNGSHRQRGADRYNPSLT